mmetsp:Transcript_56567/g.138837  ORF Transcript_56567/g.138837 Transcript_56567/m.138837 type:complete len:311 (-) Transcript_56567:158-1090(-)
MVSAALTSRARDPVVARRLPIRAAVPRSARPRARVGVPLPRPARRARQQRRHRVSPALQALNRPRPGLPLVRWAGHTPRKASVSARARRALGAGVVVLGAGDEQLVQRRTISPLAHTVVFDPPPRELVLPSRQSHAKGPDVAPGLPPRARVVEGCVIDEEFEIVKEALSVRGVGEGNSARLLEVDVEVERRVCAIIVTLTVLLVLTLGSARADVRPLHPPPRVPTVNLGPSVGGHRLTRSVEKPSRGVACCWCRRELRANARLLRPITVPAHVYALVQAPVVLPEVEVLVAAALGALARDRRIHRCSWPI